MDKIKNFALDTLFPKFCFGCRKEGIYLCEDCRSLLDILEYQYCLCDKKPFRISSDSKSGLPAQSGKCNGCQGKKLSGLYFALSYKDNPVIKKMIYQFKYEPYVKDLAKTLTSLLVEYLIKSQKNTNEIWQDSLLVPVPLDNKKIKLRGYNHSELLTDELAKIVSVPIIKNNLIKVKQTKPQMELSKEEREKNLENAFSIKNPSEFEGKKIFLVDDVYTTGSTLNQCAEVLKNIGAKQVWGICIARES